MECIFSKKKILKCKIGLGVFVGRSKKKMFQPIKKKNRFLTKTSAAHGHAPPKIKKENIGTKKKTWENPQFFHEILDPNVPVFPIFDVTFIPAF